MIMDNKIKHLEMIQGIINRMASNSFALKGWGVTLIAGIFALANKDTNKMYFLIAYIPVVSFWLLDSYYLLQERLFRDLYETIRQTPEEEIDFNMNIKKFKSIKSKSNYYSCVLSITEAGFYIPLAVVSTVIIILTCICS